MTNLSDAIGKRLEERHAAAEAARPMPQPRPKPPLRTPDQMPSSISEAVTARRVYEAQTKENDR